MQRIDGKISHRALGYTIAGFASAVLMFGNGEAHAQAAAPAKAAKKAYFEHGPLSVYSASVTDTFGWGIERRLNLLSMDLQQPAAGQPFVLTAIQGASPVSLTLAPAIAWEPGSSSVASAIPGGAPQRMRQISTASPSEETLVVSASDSLLSGSSADHGQPHGPPAPRPRGRAPFFVPPGGHPGVVSPR